MLPSCLISSCCLSSAHPGLSPPLWPSTEGPLPGTEGASKIQLEPPLSTLMGTPDTPVFLSFFFFKLKVFWRSSLESLFETDCSCALCDFSEAKWDGPWKSELLCEAIFGSSWRLHQSARWALLTSPVVLLQVGWVEWVTETFGLQCKGCR